MGQPVYWDYTLTIAPSDQGMTVSLHRIQRGTDTRFLWLSTTLPGPLERREEDAVLEALYSGCLALMELTA